MRVSMTGRSERWLAFAEVAWAVGLMIWAGGCGLGSENLGPDGPERPLSLVRVSNPSASAEPVFVSLPPGSVPGGTSATIRNIQTGTSMTVPMMDGGFDPVPFDAIAGDSLEVQIELGGGAPPIKYVLRVPANAPPIVVRTEPTSGKRDVPLNARIIIVFSEPIAPATLNSEAIRLRQGAAEVAGRVEFVDDWHLAAEFVPLAPLAPAADYELSITQEVLDLDGDPLAAPASVEFTTASTSLNRLAFNVQPGNTTLGAAISPAVKVLVLDALGATVTSFTGLIQVSLDQNPGGLPLAGVTSVAAVGGVATFADLRVEAAGVGYRLAAAAAGVVGVSSGPFNVASSGLPGVQLSPAALSVLQGSSANVLVLNAFTSTLTLTGAPNGVTATFGRVSLYQVLAVSVAPTAPPGAYEVVVHAEGSTGRDSVVLPLTVVANLAGFGLSLAPSQLPLPYGDTKSIGVSIVRSTESGPISFSVSNPSLGPSATFDSAATTGNTATVQLYAGASTSSIPHNLRIVGTGASGSSTAEVFVYTPRVTPTPLHP